MSECTCHKNYTLDTLIPKVGVITDIRQETPDVKTFRVEAPEGSKWNTLLFKSWFKLSKRPCFQPTNT